LLAVFVAAIGFLGSVNRGGAVDQDMARTTQRVLYVITTLIGTRGIEVFVILLLVFDI
jgi:hypothetical protein